MKIGRGIANLRLRFLDPFFCPKFLYNFRLYAYSQKLFQRRKSYPQVIHRHALRRRLTQCENSVNKLNIIGARSADETVRKLDLFTSYPQASSDLSTGYPQAAIIPHPAANVKFIFTNFCKRRAAPIIPHPAANVKENFNYFLHKNLTFLKPLLGKGFRR